MQTATSSPRPYLINQAGGIIQLRAFSLIGNALKVDPATDHPITGVYKLVYRCPDHQSYDIERDVSSDGEQWSILDTLPAADNCDVSYSEPSA